MASECFSLRMTYETDTVGSGGKVGTGRIDVRDSGPRKWVWGNPNNTGTIRVEA